MMEGIDVKEIFRLSLSSVQVDNCIAWSEDHKVSFMTSTALHILEVAPIPTETSVDMCLKRSIIKPPEDAPTSQSGVEVNTLLCMLDQRNAYRLLLDVKLSPNLDGAKPLEPHFLRATWSPAGIFQDQRCLIASLTNLGCLKLYAPYFHTWVQVTDISELWTDHNKPKWATEVLIYSRQEVKKNFAAVQKRCSILKITAMVWSELLSEPPKRRFSYLTTISHSGVLGFWKIYNLTDLSLKDYKPILLKTCETNLYNAQVLHWLKWNENQSSVIAGDNNGVIKMITFILNTPDKSIEIQEIKDIWSEKDNIRVSFFNSLPSFKDGKEGRILAVAKHAHFLAFLINQEEVKAYCFHQTDGHPITGLEVMNEQTFIVTTLSGCILLYSINIDYSDMKPVITLNSKVLTTNIGWNDMACFGLSKSYNKHVWAFGANLCKVFDHLVIRRPSRILFCTISFADDPLQKLRENLSNDKLFYLHENWESIELMRMNQIKLLKTQGSKMLEYSEDVDKMSYAGLQLELWRIRIFVAQQLSTDINFLAKNPEACAYATLIKELILCQHACNFISSLVNSQETPIVSCKIQTLSRFRQWLKLWLAQNKNVESGKNNETKISSNQTLGSNLNSKTDKTSESKTSDQLISSPAVPPANTSDVSENVTENDSASVGSFDDAMSSDSNSSYSIPVRTVVEHIQEQLGKIQANFLKLKLRNTCNIIVDVLTASDKLDEVNKECCIFCQQEISIGIDCHFAACPAGHRFQRCCRCLLLCTEVPFRLCQVCPAVACQNEGCIEDLFCTFCDSPLIVDEKFISISPAPEDVESLPAEIVS